MINFPASPKPKLDFPIFSTIRIMGRKARSWAISIATVTRPTRFLSALISSSIFTATAVLDNATTNPRRTAVRAGISMAHAIKNIMIRQAKVCIATAGSAILHVNFNVLTLSSMPIMKSRSNTPNSAKWVIMPSFLTSPSPVGPKIMPASRYPTSGG